MDLTSRATTFGPPRLGRLLVLAVLIALLAAAALLAVGTQRSRVPAPFGPAANGSQLVSRDGDIYTRDPATAALAPLITDPAYDFGVQYSRDGTQVMFLRAATRPVDSDPTPDLILAVARADGSGVRELVGPVNGIDWFDWSPDGTRITYLTRARSGAGLINVVDVATGATHALSVPQSAHLLTFRPPQGDEILFRGEGAAPALLAVRPDGSGFRQVNAEPFGDRRDFDALAFSPDGTTISATRWVLEDDLSRTPRVVLIDADTGRERQLPIPAGTMSRGGVFSPDGAQVAYVRLQRIAPQQNAYEVAVAPVDGSGPGRTLGPTLSLPPNGSDFAPLSVVWSPDGTAVIARYGDDDDSTYRWLPADGSAGSDLASGTFEFLDVQRVAR